jgi:hypothetical protein
MRSLRLGPPLLALAIYVLADLLAAQVCRRLMPWWEPQYFERSYRIRSPEYHHGLAPNVSLQARWGDIEYPYRTNALGFRDAAPRPVSLRGEGGRLLLLGDSFTEGLGVPYEDTFAGMLARAGASRGVEVLNAAVSSYSPSIHYRKARYYLEAVGLRVDAILVFLDVSDPYDEVKRYRVTPSGNLESVESRKRPKDRAAHWLRYNSIVGRAMTMALLASEGRASPPPYGLGQEPSRWSYDEKTFEDYGARGLRLAGQGMDSLLGVARRHGLRLAVVIYPRAEQVVRREIENANTGYWRSWAERNQVPLVDLHPWFIGAGPPDSVLRRYFMPLDVHWTASGHRLVADSLLADPTIRGLLEASEVGRLPRNDRPDVRTLEHQGEGRRVE